MKYSLRLAMFSALGCLGQAITPSVAADMGIAAVDIPERMPSDEQLEQGGARIGSIDIVVDDVFEQATGLSAPYRLANDLHVSTHDKTIENQLLFRPGEPYHRRVLNESARLLRAQRYLNDAEVEPIRYNDDNTVDVRVRVHDVWTMNPGISFGRKGGTNSTSAKFVDSNFLGLGKLVSLSRSSDVDRNTWELGYTDPNVFGSWWRFEATHASLSDGSEDAFAIGRPFYAMDSRWSASLAVLDSDKSMPRYSLGKQVDEFNLGKRKFDFNGGWSEGLRDGWVTRYRAGFRYDERQFTALPDTHNYLPTDRTLSYPYLGIELIEDEYVNTRNLEQIGRPEDLYIGRSARLDLGFAAGAFGSTHDAIVVEGELRAGADLGSDQYLTSGIEFRGRYEGGEFRNSLVELNARYFRRQSESRVLFGSLRTSVANNLDGEGQLLLGGDSGLRGYPLRYQAGTLSTLATLEERFYTRWQPLKLFNVGGAVFADAGRTWGHDDFAAPSAGWLSDVGVGLRLGSARSGLGNVLHIDIAMPLNRPTGVSGLQFLVETHSSF